MLPVKMDLWETLYKHKSDLTYLMLLYKCKSFLCNSYN